jgi:hypothetical protein
MRYARTSDVSASVLRIEGPALEPFPSRPLEALFLLRVPPLPTNRLRLDLCVIGPRLEGELVFDVPRVRLDLTRLALLLVGQPLPGPDRAQALGVALQAAENGGLLPRVFGEVDRFDQRRHGVGAPVLELEVGFDPLAPRPLHVLRRPDLLEHVLGRQVDVVVPEERLVQVELRPENAAALPGVRAPCFACLATEHLAARIARRQRHDQP